jgi:4-amino-4-deoxy-L-arabinose transferase-like glycosyltransferase
VPAFLEASALLFRVALTLLVLAVTALGLGRLLTGELDRAVERWAIPAALGLAGLAHLGFVLGLAGRLRPAPVLLVVAGIHLLGFRVGPRRLSWLGWLGWLRWLATEPLRRLRVRPMLLAAVAVLPLALLPLYPPTAFDATLYHLPFARGFVASGGLPFLADLRFPVFPQVNEMLFAEVLLFAPDVSDIAVHGVPWLMTMLTAALLWSWARDSFSSAAAGGLAAAIYLGNPIVVYLAGIGYVDAGLTLFVTSALYALRRFRSSGERRWLVLAAVFAATAADTKYLGLFFVGVIGLTVLCGRPPGPGRVRRALLFVAVAAAVLAPWYGRIYAWTGNPLFPYFPRVFGSSPWAPIRFRSFLTRPLGSRGIDLVRLPWDLVFERGRYNGQPPYSPLYLAVLVPALVAAFKDPRQRRFLGLAAVYAFACLGLPPDARYLLPAVPLVSLSAAGALLALPGRSPRRSRLLTAGLCAGCFLPGWLYALYRLHHLGPPPLTPAGREAYLARQQPCYPAVASLNRTLGSGYTVWALHAENLSYYAQGRFLGDWVGPAKFDRVLANPRGPRDLHDRLRRLKAGYLLIPSSVHLPPLPEDSSGQHWFQPVYADSAARVYRLR